MCMHLITEHQKSEAKLMEVKGEIGKPMIIVEDYNTSLLVVSR